jgi:FixJ family two-component response regulator
MMSFTAPRQSPRTSLLEQPIVFVIDDDVSVREALEPLIGSAGWSVETYGSGQDFLRRARADAPRCLVLDVELPDLNGLDLQRHLTEDKSMPIIFITGHGDIPMTVQAMKAGAVEFLTKPFRGEVLLDAIRHALERSRQARDEQADLQTLGGRYESLTNREREVMGLVVSGLLNKQVGGELGTSEPTVKGHRGQVMRKMKAASLADLVRMAAKLNLPIAEKR